MKKISHIISYLFENHLIVPLSKDWINACHGLPEFDVIIDRNNKLHLISKQIVKNE